MNTESIRNTLMKMNKKFIGIVTFFLFFAVSGGLKSNAQKRVIESPLLQNGNINCFVYHRFGDDRYPSTNISVENFRKHLDYLNKNEYNVVTFGEAVDYLKCDSPVPEKTVCLTVDDGYHSFYENALPLLKEFNYPATLFINTKQFGTGDFLSIPELKELMNAGIELGNHSHSHAHFVNFSATMRQDTFRKDLEKSQKLFLEKLGITPEVFAYPYGEYTPDMQKILRENGYKAAAAQKSGVISEYSDLFALPRFPMAAGFVQLENFIRKTKMKSLPVKTVNQNNPLLENDNTPTLLLKLFEPNKINVDQLQCFVGGQRDCELSYNAEQQIIQVQSKSPLRARRTLYTITAPGKLGSGNWYWYSYLWINSPVKE